MAENIIDTSGNYNGKINPGENISLVLSLKNFGITATGVQGKLISNNQHITMADSLSQFYTIVSGDIAKNSLDPFIFAVDSQIPLESSLEFSLITTSLENYCDTIHFSLFVEEEQQLDEEEPEITYSLSQNYPNPFSGNTTFNYSIPTTSTITISLYDISGRFVRNLFNGNKQQGSHSITFNGNELQTGVYILRLDARSQSCTKVITVIK